MKYSSTIKVSGCGKNLKKLFEAEKNGSKSDRAKYDFTVEKNDFVIHVEAKDSAAFRAVSNSISKLISVYDKTKTVIENESR